MKMEQFSHPSWDMKLILHPGQGSVALENLGEDDDESLLQMEEIEMTKEEVDALPEFDG